MTALVVLAACTSSSRPPNSQLDARVSAEVSVLDHTLKVAIDLHSGIDPATGYPTYFEIEPDEHVRIGFRDQTLDLLYGPSPLDQLAYRGTFTLTEAIAAGEEIRVEIDRNDDDDVMLTAPAPPPIALVGPATWTKADALTITWTPISNEPMAWQAGEADGPIPTDTGAITFPAGILAGPSSQDPVRVGVVFSRTGQTAPGAPFRSTRFSITQASYIVVEAAP